MELAGGNVGQSPRITGGVAKETGSQVENTPGWWQALLDLLAPLECAGCGREAQRLCTDCQRTFAAPSLVDNAAPLPVLALDRYEGAARCLILSYKERRRTDLDEYLEARIWEAGTWLGRRLEPLPKVLVIPAPSGWQRRWRGALVARRLAQAVAEGIRTTGVEAQVVDALRRSGRGSQAGRGVRSRARRAQMRISGGAIRAALGPGKTLAGQPVVLVDDVVTTGATLHQARRALENAGAITVACVVLAAVPASG